LNKRSFLDPIVQGKNISTFHRATTIISKVILSNPSFSVTTLIVPFKTPEGSEIPLREKGG